MNELTNYRREDIYNQEKIEQLMVHYREILRLLGEDPDREGLLKTPERVAKAMSFITKGYSQDPIEILRSAIFRPWLVLKIWFSWRSSCAPSRTTPL